MQCLSKLRQITLAAHTNDNNGQIIGMDVTGGQYTWAGMLVDGGYVQVPSTPNLTDPTVTAASIYHCPSGNDSFAINSWSARIPSGIRPAPLICAVRPIIVRR